MSRSVPMLALCAASLLLAAAPGRSQAADPHHAGADAGGHAEHGALMRGPLGLARTRMGSGTSWLPDDTPMYGLMGPAGRGGWMLHGNLFAGYDAFGSDRGSDQLISVGSLMVAVWHPIGPGELTLRTMFSAEPATVGRDGYPLILQSGETAGGEPMHDRQHPHDLFMELAVIATVPVSDNVGLQLYVAPAGEPALGPTAFPHRVSALSDPLAPLGHHWQDATHIAFGVLSAAIFTQRLKFDVSWFNGREPDEERWDLDLRAPDSWSGRLTWNPNAAWSVQTSWGYLHSPEALEPDVSVHRITASVTHNLRTGADENLATTLVFGHNIPSHGPATPSLLLETNLSLGRHHDVFGRLEYVMKTGHDLALPAELEATRASLGSLSAGYVFHLGPFASLVPGIGVRGSLAVMDSVLEPFYGTQVVAGGMVFVQLRFAPMPPAPDPMPMPGH